MGSARGGNGGRGNTDKMTKGHEVERGAGVEIQHGDGRGEVIHKRLRCFVVQRSQEVMTCTNAPSVLAAK